MTITLIGLDVGRCKCAGEMATLTSRAPHLRSGYVSTSALVATTAYKDLAWARGGRNPPAIGSPAKLEEGDLGNRVESLEGMRKGKKRQDN
jgi:hypothetical protein